jgi:sugar lactone lactonase YvrE
MAAGAAALFSGCKQENDGQIGRLDKVWGRHGIGDGKFQKPRAMAIDGDDRVYVVDMTARIQVFTTDGQFQRSWTTPEHYAGRPTGLSIARDGNLLVADTHYFRVLFYTPEGELVRTMGGTHGNRPGEFGLVTDCVQDSQGNFYVSEYGEYDRIQKFGPDGQFILEWGGHGPDVGQFQRPQTMAVDEHDRLWVADACNHRIQLFDTEGRSLQTWGRQGTGPGDLTYPYGLLLLPDERLLVSEFGNNRVQVFTREGKSLGTWGKPGRKEGELDNPWAVARDGEGRIHVVDAKNHRVQRIII